MKRTIDDRTILTYLLPYLSVEGLKSICRDFKIKGFSRLKKSELIEFLLDSISEEEMNDLIQQKELDIVKDGIQVAFKKINGKDRERIDNIKIVNQDEHEIEISFKGMNWESTSYLSITSENIGNPERDCDCRIGSNMGLCNHFWVGFIFSFKQGWFSLDDWSLTRLPEDFEASLSSIKISAGSFKEEENIISLVDESSEDFPLMDLIEKSITIYEGEVVKLEQKTQVFQEISTVYYVIYLSSVKFGPRINRKSDFREDDIINTEKLNLRISEKLQDDNNIKPGDKVKVNGKLTRDNFLQMLIVKNIRKIEKL
ncbi:MAG: hypothetical protein ACFFBP_14240 [Promethearchaeota archaeon]